jgi:hypothetical protein
MIQNAALDVAIALALMYLMLSLLCTIINEFIASKLLGLRAASLASGLQQILDDPLVRQKFYGHGLIAGSTNAVAKSDNLLMPLIWNRGDLPAAVNSLATPGAAAAPAAGPNAVPQAPPAAGPNTVPQAPSPEDHPSYISSSNFASALLGSLDTGKPIPVFADVVTAVTAMSPSNLRSALLSALTAAQGDLDSFRKNVANWFDDSMERLSGAYKRHLKLISILVGIVVAVVFNADSFRVASTLWTDPVLRAQVVATAAETVGKGADSKGDQPKLADVVEGLRPLPIGWSCGKNESPCIWSKPPTNLTLILGWLTLILGWLLTAAALSLGAPFWFDVLSKFINIRGAGDKPNRADANSRRG